MDMEQGKKKPARVRMKDIAESLGISVNAVSLALNNKPGIGEETRQAILNIAHAMGYLETKEKFMRTYSSTHLCVMMQKRYSEDLNFYGKVLIGVTEEARNRGFDAMVDFFDDSQSAVPKVVRDHRVAGIIVIGKISDDNITQLQGYHIPLVIVDHASLTRQADSILTDNKQGGFLITRYLLEKGLQRIGFFGDLDYSLSIKERFFGFFEALYAQTGNRQRLYRDIERSSVLSNIEQYALKNDTAVIAKRLQELEQLPEAFVCSNDRAAIAVQLALESLGWRVPEDVSLTGFDDIDMCERIRPRLTTIRVNKEAMGRLAVQRICHRIDHKSAPFQNIVMSVELIERESVKEARAPRDSLPYSRKPMGEKPFL